MDEKTKAELLNRFRSIAGHVNGITRMLEEDKYWVDILQQVLAVQSALSKVGVQVLDVHLRTCIADAIASNDTADQERALEEILGIFEWRSKLNG